MIGYSSISEAAQETGYSTDKLISFGANEIISIGLVFGGLGILQRFGKETGEIIEEKVASFGTHALKVSPICLKQAEAGSKSAEIVLGYWHGTPEQPFEMLKAMDLDTGKPVLVKDARLIVFDEDLAILKGLGKLNALPGKTNSSSTKKERNITAWLRRTWEDEGNLGGSKFFTVLKRYADKEGSPITRHNRNGIDLNCAPHTLTKKAILNNVSNFKKNMSSGKS